MKRVFAFTLVAALGMFAAAALAQASTRPRATPTSKPVPSRTKPVTQTTPAPTQTVTTQTVTTQTVTTQTPPVNRTGPVEKGTAFQWGLTQSDPQYTQQLLSHGYRTVTPEFELYMDQVESAPGVFDLAKPDAMARFARDNGLDLRGHVLVWGLQLPAWVTSPATPWTRASLLAVMQQWIATMVGHYAGQIHEWDVVNEPLNDDGTLKPNIWEQVIGPDYIQQALIAAHQADPSALLFINEYSTEWVWPKSNALYQLAQNLLAQGVPLNGIGFQLHSDTRWPVPYQDLKTNMARFAALGLRTNVTELDVGTSHFVGTEPQKQAAQAQIYSDAANACQQSPSCWSFTTWGFTDKYTWLGTAEEPLPFDLSYAPKPAWAAITAALG
jgi:endo-1,4-beta-xylanase